MARLFKFLQRAFRPLRPVRTVGFRVEEPVKDTEDLRDHQNPFLRLPNELLLIITTFLDKEFQVLLSLSCRRLRVLLNSCLDLSLCDISIKLRFLRYLEHDYPEHLTCCICGFMFQWRARRSWGYRCPRVNCHSLEDRFISYAWYMQGDRNVCVAREIVDLIFRAYERGQQHGLPLSLLSTSGTDRNSVTRTNEACLIDGQLLLASRCEVDGESRQELAQKVWLFNSALCLHYPQNMYSEEKWQTIEQAVTAMTGLERPRLFKCPFCATDYKLHVQNSNSGRMRIVLSVCRSYRQRYEKMLANEQIFHRNPSSRIDADAVSRRDLHAVFESYTSGK
jgi:hypothetical protein